MRIHGKLGRAPNSTSVKNHARGVVAVLANAFMFYSLGVELCDERAREFDRGLWSRRGGR
jgi:hypothetical protein